MTSAALPGSPRAAAAGNLPAELTSFVGRRRELDEVKRRLPESRLLTLTGAGGTGKTRLALRVASDVRRAFPEGVWFVDLAEAHADELLCQEMQDPTLLAYLVGTVLGLREQVAQSPLAMLTDYLAGRRLFLVLDNCEHVLPACAVLVKALLQAVPDQRILATSREPLGIAGETTFVVPPLPVPETRRPVGTTELSRYDSVVLFVARAGAVVPGFVLTDDNCAAVAGICAQLDGLPLAIELAARRLRVLTPSQVLDRLADRFRLLSRGNRNVPNRQQTLRACVDWSFDLCTKPERRLWARLSVFAGGFELDAVEGVCADEKLPVDELLDLVAGLIDKSVLVRDGSGPVARYRLLETIRDYGHDKLHEFEEQAALRRRHCDWYHRLAAQARAEWIGDRQTYWLARLSREFPNLRTAVEFCMTEPSMAEDALRIVMCLPSHYWWSRGLFGEGRHWLERALARTGTTATAVHVRALPLRSYFAVLQGDIDVAMRQLDEGHDTVQRLGTTSDLAFAAYVRGLGEALRNQLSVAVELLEQGLNLLSTVPESERELDLQLDLLLSRGMIAGLAGDRDRADACHQEILAITEPRGEAFYRSNALWVHALGRWLQGNLGEAAAQVSESLRLKQAQGRDGRYSTALCLELLAWIMISQGRLRRAVTLLGAADALWADLGTSIASHQELVGYRQAGEGHARDALGDTAYQQALYEGHDLDYEDAIAYALHAPRPEGPGPSPKGPSPLTPRERQVAELVARGLTNKEIASMLVISTRTAESHVERILTKLSFASRAQVAAWHTQQTAAHHEPRTP